MGSSTLYSRYLAVRVGVRLHSLKRRRELGTLEVFALLAFSLRQHVIDRFQKDSIGKKGLRFRV